MQLQLLTGTRPQEVIHLRPCDLTEGDGVWYYTPAVHKTVPQVAKLFTEAAGRPLPDDRTALCAFARERLRGKFLAADMGITGANFVTADTGTIVLVTNEGNGRMCTSLPRVHVAVMPVEKVLPRFADLGVACSVQFSHAPSDRDLADEFWAGKTDGAYAFRSLLETGASCGE